MGAKDTMQNFFMGMGGQMASGYGGKTISTPMGPFKWNDNINMWVNTNNGVVMSNISFQDQFAMIDYGTSDGSGLQGNPEYVNISPTSWGNFIGGIAGTDVWVSATGPVAAPASATPVTFSISSFPGTPNNINVSLTLAFIGLGGASLIYVKNSGLKIAYTTPISIASGDTLKIGLTVAALSDADATITVRNAANQNIIETISGSVVG